MTDQKNTIIIRELDKVGVMSIDADGVVTVNYDLPDNWVAEYHKDILSTCATLLDLVEMFFTEPNISMEECVKRVYPNFSTSLTTLTDQAKNAEWVLIQLLETLCKIAEETDNNILFSEFQFAYGAIQNKAWGLEQKGVLVPYLPPVKVMFTGDQLSIDGRPFDISVPLHSHLIQRLFSAIARGDMTGCHENPIRANVLKLIDDKRVAKCYKDILNDPSRVVPFIVSNYDTMLKIYVDKRFNNMSDIVIPVLFNKNSTGSVFISFYENGDTNADVLPKITIEGKGYSKVYGLDVSNYLHSYILGRWLQNDSSVDLVKLTKWCHEAGFTAETVQHKPVSVRNNANNILYNVVRVGENTNEEASLCSYENGMITARESKNGKIKIPSRKIFLAYEHHRAILLSYAEIDTTVEFWQVVMDAMHDYMSLHKHVSAGGIRKYAKWVNKMQKHFNNACWTNVSLRNLESDFVTVITVLATETYGSHHYGQNSTIEGGSSLVFNLKACNLESNGNVVPFDVFNGEHRAAVAYAYGYRWAWKEDYAPFWRFITSVLSFTNEQARELTVKDLIPLYTWGIALCKHCVRYDSTEMYNQHMTLNVMNQLVKVLSERYKEYRRNRYTLNFKKEFDEMVIILSLSTLPKSEEIYTYAEEFVIPLMEVIAHDDPSIFYDSLTQILIENHPEKETDSPAVANLCENVFTAIAEQAAQLIVREVYANYKSIALLLDEWVMLGVTRLNETTVALKLKKKQ